MIYIACKVKEITFWDIKVVHTGVLINPWSLINKELINVINLLNYTENTPTPCSSKTKKTANKMGFNYNVNIYRAQHYRTLIRVDKVYTRYID